MHRTEKNKFTSSKYFNRNNIIPIAFSVFSIIFVSYILVGAVGHYLVKYLF
jgi:hypothetical protein